MLPLVEFALNYAVHASTGFTTFYVNGCINPCVSLTSLQSTGLSGGGIADISPVAIRKQVKAFVTTRMNVLRRVKDQMAESQDVQKEQADAIGKKNLYEFKVGEQAILNAKNIPTHAVSAVFKTKLRPRFYRTFHGRSQMGLAYTLNLPKKMHTHPVFYVGLLKPYRDPALVRAEALEPHTRKVAAGPPGH